MEKKQLFLLFIFLVIMGVIYRIMRAPTAVEYSNLYSRVNDAGDIKTESSIPGMDTIYNSLKMY